MLLIDRAVSARQSSIRVLGRVIVLFIILVILIAESFVSISLDENLQFINPFKI